MATEKTLKTRFVQKHDTVANWTREDVPGQYALFVPKNGEIIIYEYEDGHRNFKIGDGKNSAKLLPFSDKILTETVNNMNNQIKEVQNKKSVYYTVSQQAIDANKNNADTLNGKTWQNMLLDIYPIGSIYLSMSSNSPKNLFGGEWEQIKDTFLLASGQKYTPGSTGGEAEHILTAAESPKHSHTRGTMDIEGSVSSGGASGDYGAIQGVDPKATGAYTINRRGNSGWSGSVASSFDLNFQASRNWTGNTSEFGENQPHNNMPPYLAVYVWKRIS